MTKPGKDEQGHQVLHASSIPLAESAALASVGAVVGANGGPVSAALGAAIGGAIGWVESNNAPDGVDPDKEIKFWKENFESRYYYSSRLTWKDFEPAYLLGIYFYEFGKDYEELRSVIQVRWSEVRGDSSLTWDEASDAARDAWKRLSLDKR